MTAVHDVLEHVSVVPPAAELPAAARILAETYPQIVDFDSTGMSVEEVHYFLGESAAIAYFQYRFLLNRP
ncbi:MULTISPECIES: hypothetical protein [Paenarthrobacter]|uniref:Uncharacterized protein n=1 Tax=Paenarthrobacter ureafaciens TaxID=37931 RepID=A0AAX3EEL3_PAEUR|nr:MULTISPECIES: hypothetical protein [Paenarthrobacter]NKR13257.1 hypothetical protein [Arthrobacter sp. M5]NKR14893.1 hypothetical protein [Arthrobacter sp. M6]OEH62445.1 hypothetical protein A5N13_01955 [Arthrobacter sp. D4]OEH63016.1 hypothetical protein A5N17_10195 [Arthrobacter sp. D2]MDO5865196.1 hypothetical protein [Paenarthrobacter sp. SD-2]